MREFLIVFVTVFLAEMGDKTQLATLGYASEQKLAPVYIFLASAGALVASSALAVALGTAAERWLTVIPVKLIAGVLFVAIGLWTIAQHFKIV